MQFSYLVGKMECMLNISAPTKQSSSSPIFFQMTLYLLDAPIGVCVRVDF